MNKMCIIGNLTKDPEVRSTQSGVSVCSFTVAVNRRKKGQNGEELPPMFYRATVWRTLAEICGKFLKKGSKVYVEGDLSVSTYQGNDGNTRFSLDIDVKDIEFLSSNQQSQNSTQEQSEVQSKPPVQQNHQMGFTEVQMPDDELPF